MRRIREYTARGFGELLSLVASATQPFIIRDAELLDIRLTDSSYRDLLASQTTPLTAIDCYNMTFQSIEALDAYRQLQDDALEANFIDTPVDTLEPLGEKWVGHVTGAIERHRKLALCFIMTRSGKITPFHLDPPYGGGWMQLVRGHKTWWIIDAPDLKHLRSRGYDVERLNSLSLDQLLEIEDGYLRNRLRVGDIRDRDFIWFPPDALHRVETVKPSCGLGGYL